MFIYILYTAFALFGYLLWIDSFCELKDLRKEVRKAILDIERVMPKATHSVKTEVLSILRKLKC